MPFNPASGPTDIILGLGALATIVAVIRAWVTFWDDDFSVSDRRLATQVAVFVIPPAVVLLHELGHYFAARALGVNVVGFHYGLFEGSVTIAGRRSFDQEWVIALAGNAVSAIIGLSMAWIGLVAVRQRRALRYVLLAGGLLEVVFALVAYPLLSLTTRFGDWIVIYDTKRTPGLSWATAVVHVALLLGLWQWWRQKGKAAMFAIASGSEEALSALQQAIETAPQDPAPRLALADYYARRAELSLARKTVEEGIEACGDTPRLLLGLTRLSMFQGRWNDAMVAARRGLEAGQEEEEIRQPLWANLALAFTQMQRPEYALTAYEHLTPPLVDDLRVRYGRGLVRIEAGDRDEGRADLQVVVDQLPEDHLLRKWAEARLDGHPLQKWENPGVPNYQRSSSPPPAPLAGL